MTFQQELEQLINKHSLENECNTPDFILADFMMRSLKAAIILVNARCAYYGGVEIKGELMEAEEPLQDAPTGIIDATTQQGC
jgi:Ca2+-dependent lipid-binding protein